MKKIMNNFTKTESLPKTGHVNEVCKEWLVREDGALAYKLQSQEITDYYKGNRFRNAVVREDFPTALHEQIKEKENAEKQTEVYRRRLSEQEEHDKRVAKEIADKLERDLQEQQQREFQESEIIAQQMQEIYVNLPRPPPPASRDKSKPPPPRPAKGGTIFQQSANEQPTTSNAGNYRQHHHQQQQHFHNHHNNTNGFVNSTAHHSAAAAGQVVVSDELPPALSPHHHQQQQTFNQFVERSNKIRRTPPALTNDNFPTYLQQPPTTQVMHQQQQQQHYRHQHQHSITSNSSSATTSSSSPGRRNVYENHSTSNSPLALNSFQSPPNQSPISPTTPISSLIAPNTPPIPPQTQQSSHPLVDEFIEYSDVADSIRRYDISPDFPDAPIPNLTTTKTKQIPLPQKQPQQQKLQPHNSSSTSSNNNFNKILSPSNENLLRADHKFQKLSPEKYDQLVGNDATSLAATAAAERHMQQHADDIDVYVDPCDYASLRDIGLPMEEIKEMSKKIKQEQKDELLARRLQEMEAHDGLTLEERDRLLAIEAQDKELAKMLQEREKAKAKRAKEKARLRKSQHRESGTTSCGSTSNGLHCGPLLPLPHDCMSSSKHSKSGSITHNAEPPPMGSAQSHEELLDVEAYSNPFDVLNQQRRLQNGDDMVGNNINGNGSLTREQHQHRDDDIYTLPVDSCHPGQRPVSLSIGPENGHLPSSQHNSMTRSENYSLESHDSVNAHDISPRINYTKQGSFDKNSSPTPPYMPIQGTRRSNSNEERKKKSKDKCTHQ